MANFGRTSFKYMTKDEEDYYKKIREEQSELANLILDSSLITQTKLKMFDVKLVDCGNYKQLFFFPNNNFVTDSAREKISDRVEITVSSKPPCRKTDLKKIELKNIKRSRICLSNLVKCNVECFKTFITLTFSNENNINLNDVADCNKNFNIWRTYIKRLFPDFKYVCVPEFQKRGAVHYHLLTNIDYDSNLLSTERKIWNKKEKRYKIGKDVVGWKYGINMAIKLENINVIGYITKYLNKDIDDRLFGRRRYFYSQNLNTPKEYYIDTQNMNFYEALEIIGLNNYKMSYVNVYSDYFDRTILFCELEKSLL